MRRLGLLLVSSAVTFGLFGCGIPDRDGWEARLVEAAAAVDGVDSAEAEMSLSGGLSERHSVLVRLHVGDQGEAAMRAIGDAAEYPVAQVLQDYPQTNTGIVIALVSPDQEITRGGKSLMRMLEEHGLAYEGDG